MSHARISRRSVLRGMGGVVVGLPFLEEMGLSRAAAGPVVEPPVRAFNVFFGLGIPAPLQNEGFGGVLEPLAPLRDKLLFMLNVDHVRCDESGINAHYDGSSAAFTAQPPGGDARTGGPSLDQVIRKGRYGDGLPPGMVPTLIAGTYFRRDDRVSRYVHSYNDDGTVAAAMQERPRDLFDRVFGAIAAGDDTDARRARFKRSVLDSVVDQYRHYTGPNSPLGAASKARLSDHLDRIREYEQRAYSADAGDPNAPQRPAESSLLHGGAADPGGEGIDITLGALTGEWRLMADLYALAILTDRARFGSLTFLSAGERIRLTGRYEYEGRTIWDFDDAGQHHATGSAGCSHEWWHKFNESQRNEQLRAHAHMKIREVAYFLTQLAGEDAREGNGKTILENGLFTISTESGDGRHDDAKRELSGVFHAISSGGGRFKTGQFLDVRAEGIDVYNTMIRAMGVDRKLGPAEREGRVVEAIRA